MDNKIFEGEEGSLQPIPFATKSQWVAEKIRHSITVGHLKPGDRLLQDELAARFKISSTPVREALRSLEADGLVKSEPHKGVVVVGSRTQEKRPSHELYRIRAALEGLAVEMATPLIGDQEIRLLYEVLDEIERHNSLGEIEATQSLCHEFHRRLYSAANAPTLVELITSFWKRIPWGLMLTVPGRAQESATEHRRVLDLVASRDASAAGSAMRDHVQRSGETAMQYGTRHAYEGAVEHHL